MKNKIIGLIALLVSISAISTMAETIPSVPTHYFNDYAGVVDPTDAKLMNIQLANFETKTSTQFVVVVYPTMDTDSSIEDYTNRIARSWKVGQKKINNGVVLFVFVKAPDGHTKIRIETGYGLEGALPDITAYQIIQNDIIPHFKRAKSGDPHEWTVGLQSGIDSVIKATQNEYTAAPKPKTDNAIVWAFVIAGVGLFIAIVAVFIYIGSRDKSDPEDDSRFVEPEDDSFDSLPAAPIIGSAVASGYSSSSSKSSSDDDGDSSSSSSFGSSSSSSDDDSSFSSSSDDSFSAGGGDFGGGGASGDC